MVSGATHWARLPLIGGDVISAQPGWYPEPNNAALVRFWDGSAWTAQRVWTGSAWVESATGFSPVVVAPAATGAPSWAGAYGRATPPGMRRRSPAGRKLWYVLTGSAAAVVVLIAVAVAAAGGNGSGSGSRQSVDYAQFQADIEIVGYIGLDMLDGYDPNQNDLGAYPLFPSDCQKAASDVTALTAHADKWPTVLKSPLSQAGNEFSAAARACSAGEFTTMQADMSKGHRYLTDAANAFQAHCTATQDNVLLYKC
jgi:hypothetical protein